VKTFRGVLNSQRLIQRWAFHLQTPLQAQHRFLTNQDMRGPEAIAHKIQAAHSEGEDLPRVLEL